MHQVLRRASWAAFLASLLALSPVSADAQQQRLSLALVALNTVMDFRVHWVGDSTRVDACSAYRALGNADDFAAGFLPSVLPLLDRTSEPCAEDPSRVSNQRPLTYVRVDSVVVNGDSTARVHLTVRKQTEQRYFETYEVGGLNRGPPLGWVREVRVWGVTRDYLVRPGGVQSRP